jgi:hypothetical protein
VVDEAADDALDHRDLDDGQQLLWGGERQRSEPRPEPPDEDDRPHGVVVGGALGDVDPSVLGDDDPATVVPVDPGAVVCVGASVVAVDPPPSPALGSESPFTDAGFWSVAPAGLNENATTFSLPMRILSMPLVMIVGVSSLTLSHR